MAVRNFNEAEKQKLIQIINQGSQVLGEVDDLKVGLRDTVKAIAEELELKPALPEAEKFAEKKSSKKPKTPQNPWKPYPQNPGQTRAGGF